MSFLDAAAVFVVIPVDDVVATVFDSPVAAVILEYLCGCCLLFGFAGDAIGKFATTFSAFFVDGGAFHPEGLADTGKIEVIVEVGGYPNFTGFDASMIGRIEGREIRFPVAGIEIQRDVLQEVFLVSFGGEGQ